jgi:hypothetical protein
MVVVGSVSAWALHNLMVSNGSLMVHYDHYSADSQYALWRAGFLPRGVHAEGALVDVHDWDRGNISHNPSGGQELAGVAT